MHVYTDPPSARALGRDLSLYRVSASPSQPRLKSLPMNIPYFYILLLSVEVMQLFVES